VANSLTDDGELVATGAQTGISGGYILWRRLNASSGSLHWPVPRARRALGWPGMRGCCIGGSIIELAYVLASCDYIRGGALSARFTIFFVVSAAGSVTSGHAR